MVPYRSNKRVSLVLLVKTMIKELKFERSAEQPASGEELRAFAAEVGLVIPGPLIEFCQRYNGGFLSHENKFYQVPERYELYHEEYGSSSVAVSGISLDGLYGLPREFPQCDMRREFQALRRIWTTELIPIGFDLLGNYVALRNVDPDDFVYWVDHELWEGPSRPKLFPICKDLEVLYNSLSLEPYMDA
jgi:hypothetical protein